MPQQVNRIGSLPILPDEVIRHILSHLPTKISLSSCILSKSLMSTFPLFTNLDFDDSLVFTPQRKGRCPIDQMSDFMDFVDWCIIRMNVASVDKFCLKCGHEVDTLRVNSWIGAAPLCNVRELDICINSRDFKAKPLSIFTCSTLVVLKLGTDFLLDIPDPVDLPCLKILHLSWIEFPDDKSAKRLFSSCPLLEELSLVGCCIVNIRELDMSSPSLKRLTVVKTIGQFFFTTIILDAPNLEYLEFASHSRYVYKFKNLYSLSEAHISVAELYDYSFRTDINRLLRGICNVQSLYLSGHFGEFCVRALDREPLFEYLTCLTLICQPFLNLSIVMTLLRFAPNLRELSLDGNIRGVYKVGRDGTPSCMAYCLKAVKCRMVYDDVAVMQKNVDSLESFLEVVPALRKMWMHIRCADLDREAGKRLGKMMKPIRKLGQSKGFEIKFFREEA